VGLHSYGFTDKGLIALASFTISQFLLMGLCLIPNTTNRMGQAPRKK
jgi:hypothetical protein